MGLFAKKSKAEEDQSIDASEATEAEQQPAIVEGKRSRGFLRKRPKNEAQVCMTQNCVFLSPWFPQRTWVCERQEDLPSGAASESNLQPAQSTAKKGWLGRTSKVLPCIGYSLLKLSEHHVVSGLLMPVTA